MRWCTRLREWWADPWDTAGRNKLHRRAQKAEGQVARMRALVVQALHAGTHAGRFSALADAIAIADEREEP
jgi:hypothetical protein